MLTAGEQVGKGRGGEGREGEFYLPWLSSTWAAATTAAAVSVWIQAAPTVRQEAMQTSPWLLLIPHLLPLPRMQNYAPQGKSSVGGIIQHMVNWCLLGRGVYPQKLPAVSLAGEELVSICQQQGWPC